MGVDADEVVRYGEGIITDHCGTSIDHAVNIVGYGSEEYEGEMIDFWVVRNSWGWWWGEDGYFRVKRTENKSLCGLLEMSSIVSHDKTF